MKRKYGFSITRGQITVDSEPLSKSEASIRFVGYLGPAGRPALKVNGRTLSFEEACSELNLDLDITIAIQSLVKKLDALCSILMDIANR